MKSPILYRWWDADGRLLYVGKSVSVFARIAAHRRDSAFFAEAATMTMERFETARDLGMAEVSAIRNERPLYNIVHSLGVDADRARKITVLDGPIPSLDTNVGHWDAIEASAIRWTDLIRCTSLDGSVVVQGIVDDDFLGEEFGDQGDDGWYLLTDDGSEALLWKSTAELLAIDRWVCAATDDSFRANILSGYIDSVVAGTLTRDEVSA